MARKRSMTRRRKTTLTIIGGAGVSAVVAWFLFPALRQKVQRSWLKLSKPVIGKGTTAKTWKAEDRAESEQAYNFAYPLIEAGVPPQDLELRMKLEGFTPWAIEYAKSYY